VVAIVLTTSAVLKFVAMPLEARAPSIEPVSLAFQAALAVCEGGLALWLLSGRHPRQALKCAALCFFLFAAASLVGFLQGEQSCGCFGHVRVHPGITFVLDAGISAVLLMALGKRSSRFVSSWLIFAVLGVAVTMVGLLYVIRPLGVANNDEQRWRGRSFQLSSAIDIGPELLKGRWVLLVYSSECSECRGLVRDYEWLAAEWEKQAVGRVALLETGGVSPERQFASGLPPAMLGHLKKGRAWPGFIPMMLSIKDSIIVDFRQGSVDCALDKSGLLDPTPKQTPMPKDPKNHG
jgi:hypothetical protein